MNLLLFLTYLWINPEIPEALFLPNMELETPISIHAWETTYHAADPIPRRTYQYIPGTPRQLNKIVYGYLPYWISDTSQIRWQDLSHLAYFSVELNTSGGIVNRRGWPDQALVQTAHAAGVDVEVVFTLFGNTEVATLLNSASARATAITNMVNEMESGGADGINIDFEFVPDSARDAFVMFLQALRNELNNRGHIHATISFAAPTSLAGGLDLPAIFQVLDYYFIMAYGYFWSGSSYAGPTGMLRTTPTWSSVTTLSLLRSLAIIGNAVGEDMRHKIIAGLPLYGREWITASGNWPSQATSHVGSVTYSAARARLAEGKNRLWDEGVCNPVIIWQQNGAWHQVWYDDEQSLTCKFQLAKEQNIGGIGYWALGYDNGYSEIWDALEAQFTQIQLGEGSRDNPIRITSFPYSDTRDTATGGYRYFNYYGCRPDLDEWGREFVYQMDVCQPGQITATVPDDPNIDPDIHLLSDLREDACITRAHLTFTQDVTPGRYYLVVDTYVSNSVELEGPYTVNVNFTPTGGSPCPADTTCEAGVCVCAGGQTLCDDECVDTNTDAHHCGACNTPCNSPYVCTNGQCVTEPMDAGTDTDTDSETDAQDDTHHDSEIPSTCTTTTKCACRSVGTQHAPMPFVAGVSIFLVALLLRRRIKRNE